MKYLGIDYGKKKIGLALSDGTLATPYKVLQSASLKDSVIQVSQIVKKEEVKYLVIGVPESGESLKLVNSFLKQITAKLSEVTVVKVPETLSSFDAKQVMIDLGTSKKSRSHDDAYAAAGILQKYLDSLSSQ